MQFDFWVGTWDVFDPDGKKVGENDIRKILNGCVVFENWQSARGQYAGKSFNTYDPVTRQWNQVWVDTTGATIHFSGSYADKVMAMDGVHVTVDGTVRYRMHYFDNDDGTVRQLWEQSADSAAWTTIFDGLYRRRTPGGE